MKSPLVLKLPFHGFAGCCCCTHPGRLPWHVPASWYFLHAQSSRYQKLTLSHNLPLSSRSCISMFFSISLNTASLLTLQDGNQERGCSWLGPVNYQHTATGTAGRAAAWRMLKIPEWMEIEVNIWGRDPQSALGMRILLSSAHRLLLRLGHSTVDKGESICYNRYVSDGRLKDLPHYNPLS